jgi:hypothetical protein
VVTILWIVKLGQVGFKSVRHFGDGAEDAGKAGGTGHKESGL